MRLPRLFAIGLAAGVPLAGHADPFPVQSGEHENFTRLVTQLPSSRQWQADRVERTITLTLEGHEDGFDTAAIFERIPRSRIADIQTSSNSITVALACDCAASTFLDQGNFLVLDVAERDTALPGTAVPARAVENVLPAAPETRSAQSRNTIALPVIFPSAAPPGTAAAATTAANRAPADPPRPAAPLNFPRPALDRATPRPEDREILNRMQEKLVRELGSAATRGVLTPAPDRPLPPLPQLDVPSEEAAPAPQPVPPPAFGPLANVRISTSLDVPTGTSQPDVELPALSCPKDGAFDLATWGKEREPFAQQIAQARDGLYGELDRLDPKAATRLAQRYLYFGFGAEARQILELDPALAKKHAALLAMADIMDGLPPEDKKALHHAAGCAPAVILWTTLALPEPVQGAKPDVDTLLLALNELPLHLRQIVAPPLSRKLLAFGDTQGAAQALRSLERSPAPLPASAKLAQAAIALQAGEAQSGTEKLSEVAQDNSEQSPAALVALVDARIAEDQPIDIGVANLIEAYAQELRGTEMGAELRRVHVLALLKSGQFDAAFAAKTVLGGDDMSAPSKRLRRHLIRELTKTADDIVFLEHIFDQSGSDLDDLPQADLVALAARFLRLGFAEHAEMALSRVDNDAMTSDQKILASRIALEMGKPAKAQASLLGVEGETATILRADAKRMAGALEDAHALYAESDQNGRAAETAWLSEDWRALTDAQTPVFGPTSDLAAYTSDVSDDLEGMLARTTAALEESVAARQTLNDLLNAEALRAPPEN